ncbi:MAG: transcriptional repressor [Eubacteriales bacterium]|nr:transcriptional repressor [Eubacteriales bacterium]
MAALKHSRQRDAILESLQHRTDHPTAATLYDDIRTDFPNISLGTVYRNLALLSDLGMIRKLTAADGADHYDGNVVPHNHFLCRCCNSILDLPPVDTASIAAKAAGDFDGTIESCSVSFYGVCGSCRKDAAN